jgi:carbon-monoxide dehydrogenase large subunit
MSGQPLPVLIDPHKAMGADAPVIREDLVGKDQAGQGKRAHDNHIFTWEVGDPAGTESAFGAAEVTVRQEMVNPRVHPCPLETCGCVASMDKVRGELTVHMTSQAPHIVRTVVSMLSGIAESRVRIVSPDIGGGFGNKVGVYPGYVVAIVGSIVLGRPVKWVEDRIENLSSTAFARDYHMTGELAADREGHIRRCASMSSPITAPSTRTPSRPNGRQGCSASAPAPMTSPLPMCGSTASTPTRRPAGSPTAAPSGSPRPST